MKFPIAFSLALSVFAVSCANNQKGSGDNDSFRTENIKFDRVAIASYGTECVASIDIDYPVPNGSVLGDSVREWIVSNINSYDGLIDVVMSSHPSATLTDGKFVVDAVGSLLLDSAVVQVDDMQKYFGDQMPGYEYIYKYSRGYENDTVLTYNASVYRYLGGAHGGETISDATFVRDSGLRLTWDNMFVAGYERKLLPLIKRGLMTQYFDVDTETELADCLLVSVDELTLPSAAPCYEADGVKFTYQQYEIAPYSAGHPTCTIPYADLVGILRR
ncbi:MAG: DUF3298 and DUF4163 domain-containing protein [Muribaculaceae bacterium]|nr:DUF3298 and DUF4163 domain-containing protein [Muribaculaceae bacterium]